MFDFLVPIIPVAFPILWFGGTLFLFFRFRQEQVAYLRRFPSMEPHVTLDMYTSLFGSPRGTRRRIYEVMFKHQADPEWEALRRAMWRRFRLVALWGYGFPLLTFGVAALLTVAGLLHSYR